MPGFPCCQFLIESIQGYFSPVSWVAPHRPPNRGISEIISPLVVCLISLTAMDEVWNLVQQRGMLDLNWGKNPPLQRPMRRLEKVSDLINQEREERRYFNWKVVLDLRWDRLGLFRNSRSVCTAQCLLILKQISWLGRWFWPWPAPLLTWPHLLGWEQALPCEWWTGRA